MDLLKFASVVSVASVVAGVVASGGGVWRVVAFGQWRPLASGGLVKMSHFCFRATMGNVKGIGRPGEGLNSFKDSLRKDP